MRLFGSKPPSLEEERRRLEEDRRATEAARRQRQQVQNETPKIAELCMQLRSLRHAH